jgi:hypothetical protein
MSSPPCLYARMRSTGRSMRRREKTARRSQSGRSAGTATRRGTSRNGSSCGVGPATRIPRTSTAKGQKV